MPVVDLGDVVASITAPPGSVCFPRRVVLRETAEKKRYLEMWLGDVLEVSKDVSNSHGSFYADGMTRSILEGPMTNADFPQSFSPPSHSRYPNSRSRMWRRPVNPRKPQRNSSSLQISEKVSQARNGPPSSYSAGMRPLFRIIPPLPQCLLLSLKITPFSSASQYSRLWTNTRYLLLVTNTPVTVDSWELGGVIIVRQGFGRLNCPS